VDCPEITQELQLYNQHKTNNTLHLLESSSSQNRLKVISLLLLQNKIYPVLFMNVAQSRESKAGKSFINEMEAQYIIQFLSFLVQKRILIPPTKTGAISAAVNSSSSSAPPLTVAIISPYKAQVRNIQNKCFNSPVLQPFFNKQQQSGNTIPTVPLIEINTVDGFQGREKDIVLISTVRANSSSSSSQNSGINNGNSGNNRSSIVSRIGFVSDERRLNVAITRAKKSLIIFGHKDTLMVDSVWREMINSLKDRNRIVTPQEMNLSL
jgi:superfamily I DNA and/or RNA helicase